MTYKDKNNVPGRGQGENVKDFLFGLLLALIMYAWEKARNIYEKMSDFLYYLTFSHSNEAAVG